MRTPSTLAADLRAGGYEPRRRELLALAGVLAEHGPGARALLLEGPPGAGKTALAEATARALSARLVVAQCHAWTDADELFVGVDVAAAVSGDAAHVRQPGVLAVVATAAEEGEVVLLLDEVDKTSERAEALLLDWLQSGRVPVQPGRHLVTRLERVLVVLTSNGQRDLGDALLRRVRRVRLEPLPVLTQNQIVAERTGAPAAVVTTVAKAARAVAEAEGNSALSLQEICRAVSEAWGVAASCDDLREVLAGWAARTRSGADAARREPLAAAAWAEIVAARRRGTP